MTHTKPVYKPRAVLRPIIASAAILPLMLGGCGSAGNLWDVVNNRHDRVLCSYERGAEGKDSTEYTWKCEFSGRLPPADDGSPLGSMPAAAAF